MPWINAEKMRTMPRPLAALGTFLNHPFIQTKTLGGNYGATSFAVDNVINRYRYDARRGTFRVRANSRGKNFSERLVSNIVSKFSENVIASHCCRREAAVFTPQVAPPFSLQTLGNRRANLLELVYQDQWAGKKKQQNLTK